MAKPKLIRSGRPLIVALGNPRDRSPGAGVTRAARELRRKAEEQDQRDKALIAACKDLALNDPEALRAVEVKK